MSKKKQSATTLRIDLLPDLHEKPSRKKITIQAARPKTFQLKTGNKPQSIWGNDFNQLFSNIYEGALITTTSGLIVDANERAVKMLGFSSEELRNIQVVNLVSCADESLLETINDSLKDEKYILIQAYCLRKDESVFASEISVNMLHLADHDYLSFFIRDTSMRQNDEELRRQMQFIINRSHAVAFKLIPEEHLPVEFLTDNIIQYGFEPEVFMNGQFLFEQFLHPDDGKKTIESIIHRGRNGYEETELECRVVTREKETRWIHLQGWYARDEEQHPLFFQGVFMDISERKHIEEERTIMEVRLRQAQKLESMGQLAAGIAHEINTPTQFVGDSMHFLQNSFFDIRDLLMQYAQLVESARETAPTHDQLDIHTQHMQNADFEFLIEEIPRALERSQKGIKRIADIVLAMKEFSHPGTSERSLVDINKAIENGLIVAKNEWKYVAEVDKSLDQNIPLIRCIPGEINQVILNILVNAAQAIEESLPDPPDCKGTITIRTVQENQMVHIAVSDSGKGISPELQTRIFDPFFTTKEVGKGTGQGLTIAYNIIVNRHGGKLYFDSVPDKGTTFHIVLPVKGVDPQDVAKEPRQKVPGFI